MIGSEILKNAGIKPTRPTVFNCLDLDLQMFRFRFTK